MLHSGNRGDHCCQETPNCQEWPRAQGMPPMNNGRGAGNGCKGLLTEVGDAGTRGHLRPCSFIMPGYLFLPNWPLPPPLPPTAAQPEGGPTPSPDFPYPTPHPESASQETQSAEVGSPSQGAAKFPGEQMRRAW